MDRRKLVIMAITILLVGIALVFFLNRPSLPPEIPYKPPPMISGEYSPRSFSTVSQGSTFQLNITQTSFLDSELSLTFENLTIMAYNDSTSQTPSQELTLNYTFSNNPIIISPNGTNSTILTVTFADDAQIGKYLLYIKYGNSNITHVSGHSLIVTVEKANPTPTPSPTTIENYQEITIKGVSVESDHKAVIIYAKSTGGLPPWITDIVIRNVSGNIVQTLGIGTISPPAQDNLLAADILYTITSTDLSSPLPEGTYTASIVTYAGENFISPTFTVQNEISVY